MNWLLVLDQSLANKARTPCEHDSFAAKFGSFFNSKFRETQRRPVLVERLACRSRTNWATNSATVSATNSTFQYNQFRALTQFLNSNILQIFPAQLERFLQAGVALLLELLHVVSESNQFQPFVETARPEVGYSVFDLQFTDLVLKFSSLVGRCYSDRRQILVFRFLVWVWENWFRDEAGVEDGRSIKEKWKREKNN